MLRHFLPRFIGFSLMVAAVAVTFLVRPTPDTFLMLAALVSLLAVARPSSAPVRSFWLRLTARSPDPVPSTI